MVFKSLKWICQLSLLLVSGTVSAGDKALNADKSLFDLKHVSSCPVVKAHDQSHNPVYFHHHRFPDGVQDLAIAIDETTTEADIKRVTFGGGSPDCLAKYLAIARGGNWGWHLLWLPQDSSVLHYARMDGEAWVTSPVKRLAKRAQPVHSPAMLTSGEQVWVVWAESSTGASTHDIYAVHSDDEGRNWREARLIGQLAHQPGEFRLVEKEQEVYLDGNGLSSPLPLSAR